MFDWTDIILRLGVAALAGGTLGLNRDLHGKPIGLRTLGLVSLSTALVVMVVDVNVEIPKITDATSRVIQGILTGIGFLGAGVIVRTEHHNKVHGLTSAACTWLTACVGITCGLGQWRLVLVALAITFMLLIFGGGVERLLHGLLGGSNAGLNEPPPRDQPPQP